MGRIQPNWKIRGKKFKQEVVVQYSLRPNEVPVIQVHITKRLPETKLFRIRVDLMHYAAVVDM